MTLALIFGGDADLIDVPAETAVRRAALQEEFFEWLYDPRTAHRFWDGAHTAVCYRSDAFIEWLCAVKGVPKAEVRLLAERLSAWDDRLPCLYF